MKISITGASGFVGQNLIKYLKLQSNHILMSLDLRLQSFSVSDSNVIIHLAGKAHDLRKVENFDEYYSVNYQLTKELYDAFLVSTADKFIFISSVKAVADVIDEVLTEDIRPQPETHYGKSKLMAEDYIINQQLPSGKSYYIIRPCMIHGPGNKGNLNLLFKFVSSGFPYPLGAFKNTRSFLSIDNLCFILKEIVERNDIPSGVYNAADDRSISTSELISLLSISLKIKPRVLEIPTWIVKKMARIGDIMGLAFNTERLSKLTENYVVSNKKILKFLNEPLPVSVEQGILKTASAFIPK